MFKQIQEFANKYAKQKGVTTPQHIGSQAQNLWNKTFNPNVSMKGGGKIKFRDSFSEQYD